MNETRSITQGRLRTPRSGVFLLPTTSRPQQSSTRAVILSQAAGLTISCARRDLRSSQSQRLRRTDRKSTRLNSSHGYISYAVFCLKKKKTEIQQREGNVRHRRDRQATDRHQEFPYQLDRP